MKPLSIKKIINKLSEIGFESLDFFSKSKHSNIEELGILCKTLLELKGEAASEAIAEQVLQNYQLFSEDDKFSFFQLLIDQFSPDPEIVRDAITTYQTEASQQHLLLLSKATESPRQELFRILNMAPHATQALISMRADLLRILKQHPDFSAINLDMLHLFRSWFNRGFLELKRIDWQTPALVLEKLIEYESVHEITGWDDLHRRLRDDRRCFGFFHPVMPNTPLIFVEVALTDEISTNITTLLDQSDSDNEKPFTTAVFYSINNCLQGLRGVSFGSLLIKQVVASLSAEIPSLKTYVTLSPIPGFMAWLESRIDQQENIEDDESENLQKLISTKGALALLEDSASLKPLLYRLCASYLLKEKSRGNPADPVARFHLGNGARLEQINWLADPSENGLKQSAGMMVNYVYDTDSLTRNHEAYEMKGELVCSNELKKLVGL